MLPDRVSNPGPLTYESGALAIALRDPAVSYWQKYVHGVLVNPLGGLSLPRKSVVRLTGRPDVTTNVYCGYKQQHNNNNNKAPSNCWPG